MNRKAKKKKIIKADMPEKPIEKPLESKNQVKIQENQQQAGKVNKIFDEVIKLREETEPAAVSESEKPKDYIVPLTVQYQMLNKMLIKIDSRLEFSDEELTMLVESANSVLVIYGLDIVKTMALVAFIMSHVGIIGFRIPLAIKFVKEKRNGQQNKTNVST